MGHEPGEDANLVRHHIVVRADSAGASHGFVRGLVEANIECSIGHQINAKVREALLLFQEEDWEQAIEADGAVRDGAWVAELTELMDLRSWGEGARLICRRERPHSGAQFSMFDFSEGYRHTCFITNAVNLESDVPASELRHRGHARGSRTGYAAGRAVAYRTCPSVASPRTSPGSPPASSPARCLPGRR